VWIPGETPRVRGVRLDDGEVLPADLVVDASGRRSPTPKFFARRGLRPPAEVAQECGLMYVSRYYRLKAGADYPSRDVPVIADLGWATAMAFPADRRTFCLLAVVAAIDPLRKDLMTEGGFSRFHASTPALAPWITAGRPIADIHTMARIDNRYRRLVDDSGPIASGVVLVGDAAMHTNPTAGRGASLAFAHVQYLLSALDRGSPGADLEVALDRWTDANVGTWYQVQAGADASLQRRAEAAVRGEALPVPDRMDRLRAVLVELSGQPGPAALRLRRWCHLVSLPSEVSGEPAVLAAVDKFLARGELAGAASTAGQAGPTRTSIATAA
jgi:2-polyprenyl-6-methoxyphenol hydroxylase-like FAD-dependent oxidoreductase